MLSKSYLSNPAVSQSQLKHMLFGPEVFRHNLENPRPSTPAQVLGQAVHTLILEPHKSNIIVVKPEIESRSRKEKIWKLIELGVDEGYFVVTERITKKQQDGNFYEVSREEWDFAQTMRKKYSDYFRAPYNYLTLNTDQYDKCMRITESFKRNEDAMSLLFQCTEIEKEVYYTHNGIDFKAQLDGFSPSFVLDLKTTTANNNDRELAYTIRNYLYHFQAASYLTATGLNKYYIIFIRSEEPHSIIPIELSQQMLDEGKMLFDQACERYNDCLIFNPEFKEENRIRII